MDRDIFYFVINYIGYLGGVIWMPLLGYMLGQGIESLIVLNKKPVIGGFLGALAGLGLWIIFILPKLEYLL